MELMDYAARKVALAQLGAQFKGNPLYGSWLAEYAERTAAEADSALREVQQTTPNFRIE